MNQGMVFVNLDLTQARSFEKVSIPPQNWRGLTVLECDSDCYLAFEFNGPLIPLHTIEKVEHVFDEVYVSNAAGAGFLRIAVTDGRSQLWSRSRAADTIEGAVEDANIKGTPDGGTTYVPVKVKADGTLLAEVEDAKIKGTPDGGATYVPVKVKADGTLLAEVQLSGSMPTLWGATIDDRPDASSVDVGQIFVLTNEKLDMWVSTGMSWVVMS